MDKQKVDCPISKISALLADKWTMLIMHFLLGGPKKFCELEKLLPGTSTRTITLKLLKLKSEGFLSKQVDGYYALTKKGAGWKQVENAMKKYQDTYL